ncbi:hypothetical protein HRbin40_02079 [bacterium HR40]|nr:hypothetical protein HRbin40_02079 [bacterium HR40]
MFRLPQQLAVASILAVWLAGCATPDHKTAERTLTGAAIGAASGAAVGLVTGGVVTKGVVGAIGGAAGGFAYDQLQKNKR